VGNPLHLLQTYTTDSIRIDIKIVPGASQNSIVGWLGDALKVRISAPPEKGKANKALILQLASELGIATESIKIVAGLSSQRKTVEIAGVTQEQFDATFPKSN